MSSSAWNYTIWYKPRLKWNFTEEVISKQFFFSEKISYQNFV